MSLEELASANPYAPTPRRHTPVKWAKVIDQDKCIGCHACTVACKSENEVPLSVTRTYVIHRPSRHHSQSGRRCCEQSSNP